MSEEALQVIRQKITQLTDTELQQVILLATHCQSKNNKESGVNDWYHALSQALMSRIDWQVPPMKVLPDHTKNMLNKTYEQLLAWLNEAFQPPLQKVEQRWALTWCAQLLADSLMDRDRPLCLNGLLNAAPEIPWVINEAFPGYLKSGALRWVIKNSKSVDHHV